MRTKLTPRLELIASLVPQGAFVCDVGSDHAYLPIALAERGLIRGAVAADLREGPCERARENIALHGCGDRVSVVCTDGLHGLDGYSPDCVVAAGMGAELISRIIGESRMTKRNDLLLVLQPMKYVERLREYLAAHGYAIEGEYLVRDGHLYQAITARYTGRPYVIPEAQLYLGVRGARRSPELFGQLAVKMTSRLERIIATKQDHQEEKRLLDLLYDEVERSKHE